MSRLIIAVTSIMLLVILGCASISTEPSVIVLPGTGLSLDQFSKDNIICQRFARQQLSGTPNQAAISTSVYETQLRFDIAYIQCMYTKGHQVPVYGQFTGVTPAQQTSPYAPVPLLAPKLIPKQPSQNGLKPKLPE
jgi:hypothetical protein